MKKIVFIIPGPIRKMTDLVFYEYLSEYFSGTIISSSHKEEVLQAGPAGNFTLNLIRFRYNSKLYNI